MHVNKSGGLAELLLQQKASTSTSWEPAARCVDPAHMVQARQASGVTGEGLLAHLSVQRKAGAQGASGSVHAAAVEGLTGSPQQLPHLQMIQESFGTHDVGGIQAHVGGPARAASEKMGAQAYATGDAVAFKQAPDLHTAAHEAAHVVQQRSGQVQLKGGVGEAGDRYEQHADAVADAVVQGKSAQGLLDRFAPGGQGGAVQMKDDDAAGMCMPDTAADIAGELVGLLIMAVRGELTQEQLDAVATRITALSDDEFVKLFEGLKKKDPTAVKALFNFVGDDNADKIAEKMDVEFDVPQFLFDGVSEGNVTHQVSVANTIYGRYGMKVSAPIRRIPKEVKISILDAAFNVSQGVLGNDKGEVNEADIDAAGAQTVAVLDTLHPGGKLASFWFNDIIEDTVNYSPGRTLHGQALAERTDAKYAGKEAVFCWEGSNADTLAHEMGHVLWGQGGHHASNKNLMASGNAADTLAPGANPTDSQFVLDAQQIRMFKAGVYANVKKAKPKAEGS